MMTLPRTVADVLSDHVTFEVGCIDRMYLNVWVPRLAYGGGVVGFFVGHRGNRYASTALMDPMSKAFVADIHDFIATRGLELVGFAKGQRKDELTQQFLAGFAAVDDVDRLQAICDSLGPGHIEALLRKWLKILPNPFTTADEAAGYRYELSVLQAEFSLTQMLDRPVSGRIFFEQVLHENLDIGRPDQIGLVFDRRIIRKGHHPTPGRFRTRVITDGVVPSLHIDYKNSKIKQYHKEGRALRTETTINDTRDFGLSKRLTNLAALRQIGFPANRRLLGVQRISHVSS